ncbi:TetR/AcrR family transcriptional regulator, partial [Streptomyces corynorhini]
MPRATAASEPRRAPRSRNRRGEGGHLRADILAAATDLLDHGDERAVTLRAVARRAGIAAPSIYPHFPGRSAIMLAVVGEAFAELSGRLGAAVDAVDGTDTTYSTYATDSTDTTDTTGAADADADAADADAADARAPRRLYAACLAYLDFATAHPERYRAMFGEPTHPMGGDAGVGDDLTALGADALRVLSDALTDCVTAGYSTSTDPCADAIALWLGLHGLAHQRATAHAFPWPADLVRPIVASLSRLGPPLA